MHGGKFHCSSLSKSNGERAVSQDCWKLGKHCRGVSPHARPAQMLFCKHLVVTQVGNKECKVKWMSDMIQYSCFYVLNLKPPPLLQLQWTALHHEQFMFWVLPNPARHRQFLNKKHKIRILLANSDREVKQSPTVLCPPGEHKHAGASI